MALAIGWKWLDGAVEDLKQAGVDKSEYRRFIETIAETRGRIGGDPNAVATHGPISVRFRKINGEWTIISVNFGEEIVE